MRWTEPEILSPQYLKGTDDENLKVCRALYEIAVEHESKCLESCVDFYFEVALRSQRCASSTPPDQDALLLHHSALNRLVITGQQFGRLDPVSGLRVIWQSDFRWIPIRHQGFVWEPCDFGHLTALGKYQTNALQHIHRAPGLGIPLVVTCAKPERYPLLTRQAFFAATMVLTTAEEYLDFDEDDLTDVRIDLYDPLRVSHVPYRGTFRQLAKDTSATIAFRLKDQQRTILDGFINPTSTGTGRHLYAIEPYQKGKIPVVLIHGLLSDPFTWADAINDLQATKNFVERFQIWVYEYPTGEPFLESAADLREQLSKAKRTFDPEDKDRQQSNVTLVGHSLGGLIAKLQVTYSEDALWHSVAKRPIESVLLTPKMRSRLVSDFYFDPSPSVKRVIYIGTPHLGSIYATRMVGQLASSLVESPVQEQNEYSMLFKHNPGVFTEELSDGAPTSIDLLKPDSGILNAVARLKQSEKVFAHSIVGESRWTLGEGISDGVVPVSSATATASDTTKFVYAKHTDLNKHSAAIDEIGEILTFHWMESLGARNAPHAGP